MVRTVSLHLGANGPALTESYYPLNSGIPEEHSLLTDDIKIAVTAHFRSVHSVEAWRQSLKGLIEDVNRSGVSDIIAKHMIDVAVTCATENSAHEVHAIHIDDTGKTAQYVHVT